MNNNIKTILVSPHSDDVAFSIGGTLLQKVFLSPMMMVTVFTKSNYSPCIRIKKPELISKVRHLEDVKFAERLRIKSLFLDFPEPELRGYSRGEIFANRDPTSDPIYTEVYNALLNLIKSFECELIVSPMGLGDHIDHNIAVSICSRIARENNIKIIFYEDLHYASRLTLKKIKIRAQTIDPNINYRIINISSMFNDKINNIKIYKTQARRIFQTMIKSHALRLGMENKSLKERIRQFNLYKYLIFLFTNKTISIPLCERIWYINGAR